MDTDVVKFPFPAVQHNKDDMIQIGVIRFERGGKGKLFCQKCLVEFCFPAEEGRNFPLFLYPFMKTVS